MNAIPGTRCRVCRCGAYLADDLPPACVCGHGQRDHGPQPSLPPRQCEDGALFMTTEREPTPRSRCAICREEYFVHLLPGDVALPTAQTPCHGSGSVPPITTSSPLSSEMMGGNCTTALQSYLHPPLSSLGMACTEVDSSMVPPSTALRMWSRPGPPPSGSVNDRRMQGAMAARGVSASPCRLFPCRIAQIPTGPRTALMRAPSIRNPRAKKQTSTNRGSTSQKYVIVIHPEPQYGEYGPTVSGNKFKILRGTTPNKATAFIEQMKNVKLAFDVECVAEDDAPAAPVIHQHLNQHLGQHGLEYTIRPSNAPSSSTTSTEDSGYPWAYLMTGKGQRTSGLGAKLHSEADTDSVTHAMLYKNASKICKLTGAYTGYQIVYIIPKSAVITGPLNGVDIRHFCLALRGWNGYYTTNSLEEHNKYHCETYGCVLTLDTEPATASALTESFDPSFHAQANTLLQDIEAVDNNEVVAH